MKKRYLYMCMLLIAFCVMSNLVKAQSMGNEDDVNIIDPGDASGGQIMTNTNPDGTVTYTFGPDITLTLTPDGGYVSAYGLDLFNSTPAQTYPANGMPTGTYFTPGLTQAQLDVYNPDGSVIRYLYLQDANDNWALNKVTVIQSATSPQAQPAPGIPNYSVNNYTVSSSGQYTYTFTFTDGCQLTANTDGTFTVVSGIGNCNACTANQAVLDMPYYMPQPQLPPNPTQAMINAYLQGIAIYGALAQAYHAACPAGQYKDSCGQCVGGSSGLTPCKKDCLGAWGGVTYKDSCGQCVGGNTGLLACIPPTTVSCDSVSTKLDTAATRMLNSVETNAGMKQLRDSSQGSHEVALSIAKSGSSYTVIPATVLVGTFTGAPGYFAYPGYVLTAAAHLHEKGLLPNPDPTDLYNLMNAIANPSFSNYNPSIKYSFLICGDTLIDLAMGIYDSSKTSAFLKKYPVSSGKVTDTIYFANGSSIVGPNWANFKASGDSSSLSTNYVKAVDLLNMGNYPPKLVSTYAQAVMMSLYNTGMKIMIKVNGNFKAISPVITKDSSGNLTGLTINICQ